MIEQERKPYDQQAGESEPAWQAFVAFRDLGPGRTVAAVGKTLGKSGNLVDRWCQRWNWRARAHRWDTDLDRQRRDELVERRRRTTNNTMAAGGVLLARATRLLTPPPGTDPDAWLPEPRVLVAAAGAIDKGIALQRLALGLPTSVTRQDVQLREEVDRVRYLIDGVITIVAEEVPDDVIDRVLDRISALEATGRA